MESQDTMIARIILAAVLLVSIMLSAEASNPIRGMFAKGARKLMQGGPPGSIDASYGWGSNNLLWSSQTVIDSTGQNRKISPMVKGKSKSKSGRKLQQGGPAGSVDVNYGWSTNNLLYTWQYKLDSTGSTETVAPMVKSKSKSKSNSGRKLQQGGPAGSVDINYGWSTNNLLYTWQYKLDSTGSTETVAPMVKSKSKSKSGRR